MKLLSVNLARSIWLGNVSDFNPRGMSLYSILFPFLMNTYKFRKPPPVGSADLIKGVVFGDGEFTVNNSDHPIGINITFYNDGIIAETGASTDLSDAFLEDVFNRFSEIFKMPHYQEVIKKMVYLSQVYVTTNKSLEVINPKLKQISQYLSDNVERGGMDFQVSGIIVMPDQLDKVSPAPFRLERAVTVPFSENRYFSAAPLPTSKHLELLDKLEGILS